MKILLLLLLINFSESLQESIHRKSLKALKNLHFNNIYHSSFSSLDCFGKLISKTPATKLKDFIGKKYNITEVGYSNTGKLQFFVPLISTYFEAIKDINEEEFKISLERQVCQAKQVANRMHEKFTNLLTSHEFTRFLHIPFKFARCNDAEHDAYRLPWVQRAFAKRLDREGSWVVSARYVKGTGYKKIVYIAKDSDGRKTEFILEILAEPQFVFTHEKELC